MIYELINPSDPYTFVATDREVAALVVGCLTPAYGAQSENNDECQNVPVFILGGYEEWYTENFGRMPLTGLTSRMHEVGEALRSFTFGHFHNRTTLMMALDMISDAKKREEFIAAWNDQGTSVTDIGEIARKRGQEFIRVAEAATNEKNKDERF